VVVAVLVKVAALLPVVTLDDDSGSNTDDIGWSNRRFSFFFDLNDGCSSCKDDP
jgi:hypothetical protein